MLFKSDIPYQNPDWDVNIEALGFAPGTCGPCGGESEGFDGSVRFWRLLSSDYGLRLTCFVRKCYGFLYPFRKPADQCRSCTIPRRDKNLQVMARGMGWRPGPIQRDTAEPGQVLTEAAVGGLFRVLWECLAVTRCPARGLPGGGTPQFLADDEEWCMAKDPYLVLARKWRPQNFESVVGQEHITRTLQNAIVSGRIGHAFLFIGSRGIGKTTTARILAKALNCESASGPTPTPCDTCDNCRTIAAGTSIDVIEIDGASNNGVEDVRQIRDNIRLVPSRSRYKIYVIDEVHQLSSPAFNALLKTLEEPPEHAVFILATTEAHKVPATIISRCQRYDFRRVGMESISKLLRNILDAEGVTCSDEALYAIARAADGGIRDAESILEQIISYCGKQITFHDVFDVLGLVDWTVMHRLCRAMLDQDIAAQLRIVEDVVVAGKDLSQFVQDILQYFRNLLVCKTSDPAGLLALPDEDIAAMKEIAGQFTLTNLIRLVEQFAELAKDFDSQLAQRIALEALLIRLSKVSVEVSVDTVLEKLVQLGAGGMSAVVDPAPRTPMAKSVGAAAAPLQVTVPAEDEAPDAEPEARRKVRVTTANMERAWQRVAELASGRSLKLGIALAHARPVAIEDDTIVLRFPEEQRSSLSQVEQRDNQNILGEVLSELTSNVTRCRVDAQGMAAVDAPQPDERRAPVSAGTVSQEEARTALQDPHVARVVEVFRGRIVDIKHGAARE